MFHFNTAAGSAVSTISYDGQVFKVVVTALIRTNDRIVSSGFNIADDDIFKIMLAGRNVKIHRLVLIIDGGIHPAIGIAGANVLQDTTTHHKAITAAGKIEHVLAPALGNGSSKVRPASGVHIVSLTIKDQILHVNVPGHDVITFHRVQNASGGGITRQALQDSSGFPGGCLVQTNI
ncbi:hypothetical protein SDC9_94637 [bioreactor metagenome]|uniref:Uncharacterized protein n=1 Tax=bioreactor metagenome TaxID=1076179 RepID=A0A645A4R2_9ZZZZ